MSVYYVILNRTPVCEVENWEKGTSAMRPTCSAMGTASPTVSAEPLVWPTPYTFPTQMNLPAERD